MRLLYCKIAPSPIFNQEVCRLCMDNAALEKRLWDAADELRANSKLKSSEYSVPVLGLIFLRYADFKFTQAQRELTVETARRGVSGRRGVSSRRTPSKTDYQARGVLYLPEAARFGALM